MKVHLFLNFSGRCEEAFTFYKRIFGGEFESKMTWGNAPGMNIKDDADKEKIMHMAIPLTNTITLMGCDMIFGKKKSPIDTEPFGHQDKKQKGDSDDAATSDNNAIISLNFDNKKDGDKFYDALSHGGNKKMPMRDQHWGAYHGQCVDKFGISWMIHCEKDGCNSTDWSMQKQEMKKDSE